MPKYIKCDKCNDGTSTGVCRCADVSESGSNELLAYLNSRRYLDKFHFHEVADRCHVICSLIDDILIDHEGVDQEMKKLCEDAQIKLCDVMNKASLYKEILSS